MVKKNRLGVSLALVSLCIVPGGPTPAEAQTVTLDGAIDVTQPHYGSLVLDSSVRFMRGHRLTLKVEGQIDANHKYWNQRKCKWFGLKCWYEKRSRANWVGLDQLPLDICIVPESSTNCDPPIAVNKAEWGEIASDLLASTGRLTDRFRALGRIRDPQGSGGRTSCAHVSVPGHCSAGQYKPRLVIDLSGRLTLLKDFLRQKRNTSDVVADRLVDPLTRRSEAARAQAAEIVFEYTKAKFPDVEDGNRRRLLAFARDLDPKNSDIRVAFTETAIERGEVDLVKRESEKDIGILSSQFDTDKTKGPLLSQSLRIRARAWIQDRVGTQRADLEMALSMVTQAERVLEIAREAGAIAEPELQTGRKKCQRLAVDILLLIRDIPALQRAEEILRKVVPTIPVIHRGLPVGSGSMGRTLVLAAARSDGRENRRAASSRRPWEVGPLTAETRTGNRVVAATLSGTTATLYEGEGAAIGHATVGIPPGCGKATEAVGIALGEEASRTRWAGAEILLEGPDGIGSFSPGNGSCEPLVAPLPARYWYSPADRVVATYSADSALSLFSLDSNAEEDRLAMSGPEVLSLSMVTGDASTSDLSTVEALLARNGDGSYPLVKLTRGTVQWEQTNTLCRYLLETDATILAAGWGSASSFPLVVGTASGDVEVRIVSGSLAGDGDTCQFSRVGVLKALAGPHGEYRIQQQASGRYRVCGPAAGSGSRCWSLQKEKEEWRLEQLGEAQEPSLAAQPTKKRVVALESLDVVAYLEANRAEPEATVYLDDLQALVTVDSSSRASNSWQLRLQDASKARASAKLSDLSAVRWFLVPLAANEAPHAELVAIAVDRGDRVRQIRRVSVGRAGQDYSLEIGSVSGLPDPPTDLIPPSELMNEARVARSALYLYEPERVWRISRQAKEAVALPLASPKELKALAIAEAGDAVGVLGLVNGQLVGVGTPGTTAFEGPEKLKLNLHTAVAWGSSGEFMAVRVETSGDYVLVSGGLQADGSWSHKTCEGRSPNQFVRLLEQLDGGSAARPLKLDSRQRLAAFQGGDSGIVVDTDCRAVGSFPGRYAPIRFQEPRGVLAVVNLAPDRTRVEWWNTLSSSVHLRDEDRLR